MNGGSVTVTSPLPRLSASSNGESKVMAPEEDEELPSLQQVVLKVQQSDDMKHVLNKGPWMATPAVCQAWKVFIDVSCCFVLLQLPIYPLYSGQVDCTFPGVPEILDPWSWPCR